MGVSENLKQAFICVWPVSILYICALTLTLLKPDMNTGASIYFFLPMALLGFPWALVAIFSTKLFAILLPPIITSLVVCVITSISVLPNSMIANDLLGMPYKSQRKWWWSLAGIQALLFILMLFA